MAGQGIGNDDLNAFRDLLYITALRGADSTGLLTAKTWGKHTYHKLIKDDIDASYFIWKDGLPKGDKQLDSMTADLFMGHCRAATKGVVNAANAHPFDTGKFIGAHNGTLWGKEWEDQHKTDSQLMFERMENEGIIPTLQDLTWGDAYAISIWEKGTNSLYLGRNHERPLHVGFSKKYGVMYWASEHAMLDFISARRKLDLDIYYLPIDTLFKINIDEIAAGNTTPWETFDVKSNWGYGYTVKDKSSGNSAETNQTNQNNVIPFRDPDDERYYGYGYDDFPNYGQDCAVCNDWIPGGEVKESISHLPNGGQIYVCRDCRAKEIMKNLDKNGAEGENEEVSNETAH